MSTLVMKFGGASVATPGHFLQMAQIISNRHKEYARIAVVVSAMKQATDDLLALANAVHPQPPRRELDMLVSVGERVSISLLAMALARLGKEAISFTGSQSGIITSNAHTQAQILNVRPHRLLKQLELGKIVIVAGFQGVSEQGEITTLGRGGSDTSAVAIAVALNAEKVEFYKDVPGIFTTDPKKDVNARHLPHLTYEEAMQIVKEGAKVLHLRALVLAQKNHIPLTVLSFNHSDHPGTIITSDEQKPSEPFYENEYSYAI